MVYFLAAILLINCIGFINMAYDKHQARKGKWRTPEARFFLYAVFGGAIGIYAGMKVWRHKTKHLSFQLGIPLLIIMNVVLFCLIWLH